MSDIKQRYEKTCNDLAEKFVETFFGKISLSHWKWINNDVGGYIYTQDQIFSVKQMSMFLCLKFTRQDLEEYQAMRRNAAANKQDFTLGVDDFFKNKYNEKV